MPWQNDLRRSSRDAEIAERVIVAVEQLLERDRYLFVHRVGERAISHRLAIYVEAQFPGWDVDCEYDRDGAARKMIPDGTGNDDDEGSAVLPDIIVHHRGPAETTSCSNSRSPAIVCPMTGIWRSCARTGVTWDTRTAFSFVSSWESPIPPSAGQSSFTATDLDRNEAGRRHRRVVGKGVVVRRWCVSGSRPGPSRPHREGVSEPAERCVRTQWRMRATRFCRARVSTAQAPWVVANPTAISRTV